MISDITMQVISQPHKKKRNVGHHPNKDTLPLAASDHDHQREIKFLKFLNQDFYHEVDFPIRHWPRGVSWFLPFNFFLVKSQFVLSWPLEFKILNLIETLTDIEMAMQVEYQELKVSQVADLED